MFLLLAVLLAWGLVFISVVDSSVHSSDNVVKISCSTRLCKVHTTSLVSLHR